MIYSNARLTICFTHPEKPFASNDGSIRYLQVSGQKHASRRHVPVLYQKGKMADRELNNREPLRYFANSGSQKQATMWATRIRGMVTGLPKARRDRSKKTQDQNGWALGRPLLGVIFKLALIGSLLKQESEKSLRRGINWPSVNLLPCDSPRGGRPTLSALLPSLTILV